MSEKGVITECDAFQEWLLPWWWENYTRENKLPVTFIDFGMSQKARAWCQERGELLSLSQDAENLILRDFVPSEKQVAWEKAYSVEVWRAREGWFKKPWACLHSPYEKTVWLDLDCEVLGDITLLYEYLDERCEIALALNSPVEESSYVDGVLTYNSGVIVYKKDSGLIPAWAELCQSEVEKFMGDQNVLSYLIASKDIPVARLHPIYNWPMAYGYHVGAVIIHWVGAWGKEMIQKHGGLRKTKEAL